MTPDPSQGRLTKHDPMLIINHNNDPWPLAPDPSQGRLTTSRVSGMLGFHEPKAAGLLRGMYIYIYIYICRKVDK